MRIVRYMGKSEYDALMEGKTIINHTDWHQRGKRTTSKGFCFFYDDEPKEDRIHYLLGVGPRYDYDYYVVFDAPESIELHIGHGTYRDIENDNPLSWIIATREVKELSLEEYDRQRLPIVEAYAIERDIDAGEWAFRSVM